MGITFVDQISADQNSFIGVEDVIKIGWREMTYINVGKKLGMHAD